MKELTSREMRALEVIAGLDNRLVNDARYLEERLKEIPDMWRQFRIAQTAIEKVIVALYANVPTKTLLHMRKLQENGEIVFRPKSPLNKRTDVQIVLTTDLKHLINTAMADNCAMCLRTDKDIKKCELRKVLMNVAPFAEKSKTGSCEYVNIATNHELGDYV